MELDESRVAQIGTGKDVCISIRKRKGDCFEEESIGANFKLPKQLLLCANDDEVIVPDDDSSPPRDDRGDARIYLSQEPGGVWWDDREIVKLVGLSFQSTYKDYYANWSEATQKQRDEMFDYFQKRVRTDIGYGLRSAWEERVKRRISYTMHRVASAKKKPSWLPQNCFEKLVKRKDDPEFQKNSAIKKSNRRSGRKEEKAPPTHTLGQKSAVKAFRNMGVSATPHQLLVASKKDKNGNWIIPRAKEIDDEYQRRKSQPSSACGEMTTSDEYQLYLELVGGFNPKMRVFGVGNAAQQLFTPPSNRSRASRDPYTPSLVAQYHSENDKLKEQLSKLEAERQADREEIERQRDETQRMKAFLSEKLGFSSDGTCSPDPRPHNQDDLSDKGHDFDSQSVSQLSLG